MAPVLLLVTLLMPVRLHIPGPFRSISIFDLALPPVLLAVVIVQRVRTLPRLPLWIALPIFWAVVSGAWTVSGLYWARGTIVLAEMLAAGWVFSQWLPHVGSRRAWTAWAALGLAASLIALLWFYPMHRAAWLNLQPPANSGEALSQTLRLGSPFWGPSNYLGSILLLLLATAAVLSVIPTPLRIGVILTGGTALIATLSRGALLAIAVGMAAAALVDTPARTMLISKPRRLAWLAPALAGVAVVGLLRQGIFERQFFSGGVFADPERARYSAEAVQLFLRRPIYGYGYGAWPAIVSGIDRRGVHDYYLQIAVELGLIGGILFLSFFLGLLSVARQLPPAFSYGVTAAILAVGVNILVEASFEGVVFGWVFAVFVGLTFGTLRWQSAVSTNEVGGGRRSPPRLMIQ